MVENVTLKPTAHRRQVGNRSSNNGQLVGDWSPIDHRDIRVDDWLPINQWLVGNHLMTFATPSQSLAVASLLCMFKRKLVTKFNW